MNLVNEVKFKKEIEMAKKSICDLGIDVSDNVYLICHALEMTKDLDGVYLECGVFKGSTILTANTYSNIRGINKKFIGVDTFEGFPENQITNQNDAPAAFDKLLSEGKITLSHHTLAKDRLANLIQHDHLTTQYFLNPGTLIFEESKKRNIELFKGTFSQVLSNLNMPISVFHIDCDLYEPYLECLNLQFKNLVSGGVIVLDEYYSLKYPGARIAVDEFLNSIEKNSFSLERFMTNNFERWCIIKK